jgi:hypothetical protein
VFQLESSETLLEHLKRGFRSATFDYIDSSVRFRTVAKAHFDGRRSKLYGVYLVWQKQQRTILYLGKAGTLDGYGNYKGQDIIGRLLNVRGEGSSDAWFATAVQQYGPLSLEYIVLDPPIAPAFVEAVLLQTHLSQFGHLPALNRSF